MRVRSRIRARISYDPLGERKQKSVAGVATDFVLAGGEEIADYYEASATWRLTVRGRDIASEFKEPKRFGL